VTGLQIIVLAIVQGLTEFLPISSSGHLVLVPYLVEWTDQGLAFDVAVHAGSLVAVCLFFREDILGLLRGAAQVLGGNTKLPQANMAFAIGLGTIPAAAAGLLFASWIEANLRDPSIIVYTLSGYGVLMALADRFGKSERVIADVRIRDAFAIGCAQALALVPGTSRSGVTITAARLLGLKRQDAARFSFLLSAPVILLATLYNRCRRLSEHRVFHAVRKSHRPRAVCGLSSRTGRGHFVCPGVKLRHYCLCCYWRATLLHSKLSYSVEDSRGIRRTGWRPR
jgi:undecaprenyl-diphosphatase